MKTNIKITGALLLGLSLTGTVHAAGSDLHKTDDGGWTTTPEADWNKCGKAHESAPVTAGPQAPRNIDSAYGTNTTKFKTAFNTEKMNLCDIHYHWNAEHKSAKFSTAVDTGNDHSGWATRFPKYLSHDDREEHDVGGLDHPIGVTPGDTIEVHFVHTSCNVNYADLDPDNGLGNCSTSVCANPQLRVIAQVFEVTDDEHADVKDLDHPMKHDDERVVYTGSTTGSKYNNGHCSPLQVTWDVKKTPATINGEDLAKWSHHHKQHAHAVRELVTHDDLLSPIRSKRDEHDERD